MTNQYAICSVLMAALCVVSAFLQFNEQAWYLWIPFYVGAAYVNLSNLFGSISEKRAILIANITLYIGRFLFCKVALEHFSGASSVGMWSLDMREKIVREKLAASLVSICIIIQKLAAKLFEGDHAKKVKMEVPPVIKHGMAILVGISYGLSAKFLMYHRVEMDL